MEERERENERDRERKRKKEREEEISNRDSTVDPVDGDVHPDSSIDPADGDLIAGSSIDPATGNLIAGSSFSSDNGMSRILGALPRLKGVLRGEGPFCPEDRFLTFCANSLSCPIHPLRPFWKGVGDIRALEWS